jgi:hypothetical protein
MRLPASKKVPDTNGTVVSMIVAPSALSLGQLHTPRGSVGECLPAPSFLFSARDSAIRVRNLFHALITSIERTVSSEASKSEKRCQVPFWQNRQTKPPATRLAPVPKDTQHSRVIAIAVPSGMVSSIPDKGEKRDGQQI